MMLIALMLLPHAFVPQPSMPRAARLETASLALRPSAHLVTRTTLPPRLALPNIDGSGAFKNIQEYPCELDIKVIGDNQGPFVSDILTLCAEITGQREEDVPVRWRDNGKYRAITIRLKFANSDQVYAVYAAVDRDPRVRYKL